MHNILKRSSSAPDSLVYSQQYAAKRESDIGGTWQNNSYPGAEVDVPTGLYSFFFIHYKFTKRYASISELLEYTKYIIDKFNIRKSARTNQAVSKVALALGAQRLKLTVFMATSAWILPRSDRSYSPIEQTIMNLPVIRQLNRFIIFFIHEIRFIGFRRYPLLIRLGCAKAIFRSAIDISFMGASSLSKYSSTSIFTP